MGAGFDFYVQTLRDIRNAEAQRFAYEQAQAQQLQHEIATTAKEMAANIQKDQMERGEYQFAAEQTKVFPQRPEDIISDPLPSSTQQETSDNINNIRQQILKNQTQISTIQESINKLKQSGSGIGLNNNDLVRRLNALMDANKQLETAHQNVFEYTKTPEYQDKVRNEKWKQFEGKYPKWSAKWYEVMYGVMPNKEQQELDTYRKKKEIDRQMSVEKPQKPVTRAESIDWAKEYNAVESNIMIDDEQKRLEKQLISEYSSKYKDVTDPVQIEKIKQNFNDDMIKLRQNYKPKDDGGKSKEKPKRMTREQRALEYLNRKNQ